MPFVEIMLLALSLSADSFAVSMSGSVSLCGISPGKVCRIASVFALMQAVLLFAGWISGNTVVGYVSGVAPYVACAILSYIGISMIVSAFRKESSSVELCSMRNIFLAAFATSIDALAVGVSLAMGHMGPGDSVRVSVLTFAVTFIFSAAGIFAGTAAGKIFGSVSKVAGGIVLLAIGFKPFVLG